MPIYEYQCRKCGALTEELHGISETPVVKCPECGARAEKKISGGNFVLKGSGWYVTDYGKKSQMPEKGPAGPKGKTEGAPAGPSLSKKPLPKLASDPD